MMGKFMSLELAHASSCWVYEAYAAPFSCCIFLELQDCLSRKIFARVLATVHGWHSCLSMECMSIAALSVRKLFCLSRRFLHRSRILRSSWQTKVLHGSVYHGGVNLTREWILSLKPDVGHLESELRNSAYCPAGEYVLM